MCMYVIVCDGMYFSVEIVDRNFLFSGVNITAGRARDKSVRVNSLHFSTFILSSYISLSLSLLLLWCYVVCCSPYRSCGGVYCDGCCPGVDNRKCVYCMRGLNPGNHIFHYQTEDRDSLSARYYNGIIWSNHNILLCCCVNFVSLISFSYTLFSQQHIFLIAQPLSLSRNCTMALSMMITLCMSVPMRKIL